MISNVSEYMILVVNRWADVEIRPTVSAELSDQLDHF